MWNVRRLCSQILWMEDGQVRAYGDAGEIAERYMNEVNLQALANQGTALQSHRGGTGEVRYEAVETLDAVGPAVGAVHAGRRVGGARRRIAPRSAVDAAGLPGRDRRRRHRRRRDDGELGRPRPAATRRRPRRDRHSVQPPAAAAASVRAAAVDHRRRPAGVVRHGDRRAALRGHRPGRRRRQPRRRAGRPRHRAVRGRRIARA